jgi:hypothetical protein
MPPPSEAGFLRTEKHCMDVHALPPIEYAAVRKAERTNVASSLTPISDEEMVLC